MRYGQQTSLKSNVILEKNVGLKQNVTDLSLGQSCFHKESYHNVNIR